MRYTHKEVIHGKGMDMKKEIGAHSRHELDAKIDQQLKRWEQQQRRELQKLMITDGERDAEIKTEEAKKRISTLTSMLNQTLIAPTFTFDLLYRRHSFAKRTPELSIYIAKFQVPKEDKFTEFLLPFIKRRRLTVLEQARNEYEAELKKYQDDQKAFEREQSRYNSQIELFKSKVDAGEAESVRKYVHIVLQRTRFPQPIGKRYEVSYDQDSGCVVVDYWLPIPSAMPRVAEYKYVKTKREITSKEMKKKDADALYDTVVYQLALSVLHKVFRATNSRYVKHVCFNGYVRGVDSGTGRDFTSCILTVQVAREDFEEINLSRVDPKMCFRKLKGISATALHQLAPVAPIMQLNRNDARFVAARDVLDNMDHTPNLATMSWEDFEHLIRQLFDVMFRERRGAEVKITRSSGDYGIDAVVFDDDPIFGGKIIIQAKRYNNIVPPSAVRDLWGTVDLERASRGILVTTGWFGPESYEIANDRPMSIIDGTQLIGLLQKHGYNVRIEYTK